MYNYEKYLETFKYSVELPGTGDNIEFRSLTTNDMKRLLVYENQSDPLVGEDILDQILTETVLTENFNIDNLYIQDRYFLFIELRKATKGTKYTFPYTCKNCKSQSMQSVDFNQLNVKKREDPEKEVNLLNDNIKLEMDHIKRGDQKKGYKAINKKISSSEKQIEMMLADIASSILSITTPDGTENPPVEKKMKFIGDLPSTEYQKLRDWYQNNDFGISLEHQVNCPHCDYKEETQIPLDNFFE